METKVSNLGSRDNLVNPAHLWLILEILLPRQHGEGQALALRWDKHKLLPRHGEGQALALRWNRRKLLPMHGEEQVFPTPYEKMEDRRKA